jgi:hypothetical protein
MTIGFCAVNEPVMAQLKLVKEVLFYIFVDGSWLGSSCQDKAIRR